jgi:peroxiredoxin
MDMQAGPLDAQPSRLHQLEQDFAALAPQIPDGAPKQAISLLHGMVQELWRAADAPHDRQGGRTLQDIADLHQHAPAMEGDALNRPLAVGSAAPDFALPDANGRTVRLSDFRGRPVVLAFYPLDWSPGCSRQLDLYQQELDEFRRRGVEVVGVSVDSLYSHGAWAAVRGLRFPLLADFNPKGEVARRYQVWREADGFSERALYVVDGEGVIRYAHVSPKLQHVPDIYELFAALDGLGARQGA